MKKQKVIILSLAFIVVVGGLFLGITLIDFGTGKTPGTKNMEATEAYLLEMRRLLDERNGLSVPGLCNCCDTPLIDGECPFCRGACDQSTAAGLHRFEIIANAPASETTPDEGAGEGLSVPSGGHSGQDNYSINAQYKD
jgi:hypothetical protein